MYSTQNIINLHTVKDLQSWVKGENNIYIGRQTKRLAGSKWGNPYKLRKYCRKTAVSLYKKHVKCNEELLNAIYELKGKNLGCWCSPQLCHGEVLHCLAGNIPVYKSVVNISVTTFYNRSFPLWESIRRFIMSNSIDYVTGSSTKSTSSSL